MGREVGGRVRMGNTCTPMADSCECMANPPQYCKVSSLQLKLKKKKRSTYTSSLVGDEVTRESSPTLLPF